MIEGLSHITFMVGDLERSSRLLAEVFGAQEVYCSGERTHSVAREKFFIIAGLWIALMEGEPLKERTYNHISFRVSRDRLEEYRSRIVGLGLAPLPGRDRIEGEGESFYFYDYDNHLFELHAGTLEERLMAYVK